ncbi:MAG TPA: MgtC/SapB family protein [Flavobacteriaceae bacterium]|nr:MgtC/SapB family protein [Flavobacteriaceae bacterium]
MIEWETVLMRLALASVFGAIIGLERERKNWSAGMRTHMMVCLGSALTIIVSSYGFNDVIGDHITLDPSRVAAQVVSGIGFLGAGIIIFQKPGLVRGLTTASGLWTVAGIGLATGAGMYLAAAFTTVIAFFILLILQRIERRLTRKYKEHLVRIAVVPEANPHQIIDKLMDKAEKDIDQFSFNKSETGYLIEINFDEFNIKEIGPILSDIEKNEDVEEIYWTK